MAIVASYCASVPFPVGFAGLAVSAFLLLSPTCRSQQPPPTSSSGLNSTVEVRQAITDEGLGAVQGVVVRNGKVYAYGDVAQARPRVGVIREYSLDLKATGRVVWLRRGDTPIIVHPTGLTWDERLGTFLGDTVKTAEPGHSRAMIYRLDWEAAWRDGDLSRAILNVVEDDAAVNGCRPEFVQLAGRKLLATADYGDVRPEIRLYDPEALLSAGRSSAPGVTVHRLICRPFNQNLHWDGDDGTLTCVQNVTAGEGWRLDVLDLARAVADGRADGPGVRLRCLTFPPRDELEGYWPLAGDRGLFAIARRRDNLFEASIRTPGGPSFATRPADRQDTSVPAPAGPTRVP